MTVNDLIQALDLDVLVPGDLDRAVTGGYCGDLLSWVMGRAKAGDAWMTVMGNVNAVAVAVLADTACILLVEDAALDEEARRLMARCPALRDDCDRERYNCGVTFVIF